MVPNELNDAFRGVLTMVWTMLRGAHHLFVVGTVATVMTARIYKCYAVSTAPPSSATLASLRSAPIVLHCLYYGLIVY